MKLLFYFSIALTLIVSRGCRENDHEKTHTSANWKDYKNKKTYKISVGDTIPIYSTTNSCCPYCYPLKDELKHLKFVTIDLVDQVVLKKSMSCEGCDETKAYYYRAESVGIENFKLWKIGGAADCDRSLTDQEKMMDFEEITIEIIDN